MKKIPVSLIALMVLAVPFVVSAQSVADLSAEIQQLLAEISSLGGSTGSVLPATAPAGAQNSCPDLYRSLSLGADGSDVLSLQQYLESLGLLGPSSVSGSFDLTTQGAVQHLQSSDGIVSYGDPDSTGYGVVGPRTRALIAMNCSAAGGSNAPNSCPLAPQPATACSVGWQAVTDANGCTTSYRCAIPLPAYVPPNTTVPNACTPAVSLSCPSGEYVQTGANCSQTCIVGSAPVQSPIGTGTLSAAPTTGQAPLLVTFTTVQPVAFGGSISFGDGTSANLTPIACSNSIPASCTFSLSHTYSINGTFLATLIQTSGGNGSLSLGTQTISVGGTATGNGSLYASPTSGAAPLNVTFSLVNTAPQYFYEITFGDGQTSQSLNPSSPTLVHTYATAGTYTAQLMVATNACYGVTYSCGQPEPSFTPAGTVTVYVTGTIVNSGGGSFYASPTTGTAPIAVQFAGYDTLRTNGGYSISFGDGQTSGEQAVCSGNSCTISASHDYTIPGTFEASLSWIPTCNAGTGGDCALVSTPIGSPVTINLTGGSVNGYLSITALSGLSVAINITGNGSFTVDPGDGSQPIPVTISGGVSSSIVRAYQYAGTYTVRLLNGSTVIYTLSVTVPNS